MRWNKIRLSVAAGAVALSGIGGAFAASESSLASAGRFLTRTVIFPAAKGAAEGNREADLPPKEQLIRALAYLALMDQSSTTVKTLLEQARAARDVVKSLCLNDKHNQITFVIRTGKDRVANLRSAADGNDKDRARHEFVIVLVLRDRTDVLVKEARQCIGEEAGFIGDTELTLQIDSNIPDVDPDKLGADPDILSEPPPLVSPPF